MLGFDYFRIINDTYKPKTPHAAIRAVEAGILPLEAYISRGTSVKSLAEEPYDLDEIDRVLSRENLDLEMNLLLMRVFNLMIRNPDQEIALFAAESINLIESRYNRSIEALKHKLEEREDSDTLMELARTYFEFSQVFQHVTSIKNFYLREAYSYIQRLPDTVAPKREYVRIIVIIFTELELYEQALLALEQFGNAEESWTLLLKAEIEFKRRNFHEIFRICSWLLQREDQLSREDKAIISYWLGH
jgi:tetratricopeptide (TPR) repeat protein